MFEILKKDQANIGVGIFAKIAGVSRVTGSLWINGHTKPHLLHADKIAVLLAAIKLGVDKGLLPVPTTVPRQARFDKIKAAILQCLEEVTAGK